jgi:hypothetical protein
MQTHITKNQYLEKIAKIVSGTQLIVKAEGNKSGVDLGARPITITISEDTKFINKVYDTRMSGANQSQSNIDVEAIAKELNMDVEEFKLFYQRMVLYHEIGHIIFTPAKTKTHPDVTMKLLTNFVEDARIESKLGFHYPPTRGRLQLMNRMLLDEVDLDAGVEMCIQNPDKRNIVLLSTAIAGCYYYGLSDSEPSSPAIRRMVEILDELARNPKTTFEKTTMTYSKELFDLIPGITPEDLKQEVNQYRRGGGSRQGKQKLRVDSALGQELKDQMGTFSEELKSYGIEMKNRELRNLTTLRYLDPTLVSHIHQTLKRIIGGKPSKQNVIDFEGFAVDMEGLLEFKKNPAKEVKMYERAGKKEKPEMYIVLCIDSSGSMGGGQIEVAKKSAINLSYACEKTGIKTCILDFTTEVEIHKTFDQQLIESKIGELCATGGTDISCAIKKSTELLARDKIPPNAKCAVIVLSDGCDGSARQVGEMLDINHHIHFYMVGIHDDPTQYVIQVRDGGGNCYGHIYIRDMSAVMKGMTAFAKDFVKRC